MKTGFGRTESIRIVVECVLPPRETFLQGDMSAIGAINSDVVCSTINGWIVW